MSLDPRLLEILRCPLTGQRFRLVSPEGDEDGGAESGAVGEDYLETIDGRIRYPIVGSLPMLTPGDASKA